MPPKEPDGEGGPGPIARALARELTGSLRCASCGYHLEGLSVRDRCPECGLAVQATLLSLVDPHAQELQPIPHPRLVGVGLLVWAGGVVVAVCLGWAVWLGGMFDGFLSPIWQNRMVLTGAVLTGVAGVGSIALIRPHGGIARPQVIAAAIATVLHFVTIRIWLDLGSVATASPHSTLLGAWTGNAEPAPWRSERLVAWLLLAAIVLLIRPNLRTLAARSFLLRAARVDRQTMLAVSVSLLVAAAGDLIALVAPALVSGARGTLLLLGEVLVAMGAALMTVGLFGILIDTVRLLPSVLRRPLGYRDVLRRPEERAIDD